jgi:hypothetical protein
MTGYSHRMRRFGFTGLSLFFFIVSVGQAQPTFHREISRIMQAKCQMCHRPNDIAPFSLLTYENAQIWAEDISRVVSQKIMPPWKPVEGYGEFKDSYNLSEDERNTIVAWVAAGAPEGDAADAPEPRVPTGEWQLGQHDMIVEMKEAFTPPRGRDVYRCFVVTNPLDEPLYVSAVDVLPGNRQIVHHVIMFIDERGEAQKMDDAEEGPGYTCFGGPGFDLSLSSMLGAWAPGTLPKKLPEGVAVQIPKGGRLVMQVHYFPFGRTGEDITKVGLYTTKEKVERRIFYVPILNQTFRIPAGAADHEVRAEFPVPILLDAKLYQIGPHMHQIGTKIKVEYALPGRDMLPLIFIDKWDFNWQGFYNFKESIPLPAFTRLRVTCTYDNSEGNPRNPNNPLKDIRWGEGTEDEMCLAFVGVTFDRENLLPFDANRTKVR